MLRPPFHSRNHFELLDPKDLLRTGNFTSTSCHEAFVFSEWLRVVNCPSPVSEALPFLENDILRSKNAEKEQATTILCDCLSFNDIIFLPKQPQNEI